MRKILVLGAGKSSGVLVSYLLEKAAKNFWEVIVADAQIEAAGKLSRSHANAYAVALDVSDTNGVSDLVKQSDLVISMMPPSLHFAVAKSCLQHRKNLITPSYVSTAMSELHDEAETKNVVLLNEMGLDPGIDHMSACSMIEEVKAMGGEISSFKSHCGGLIAKENSDNPWHYKFTWNPRNVVLAGQGETAIQWLENGNTKSLRYEDLFAAATSVVSAGGERFESYPNRDSLSYVDVYGLKNAHTFYRGTLRYEGFCRAWHMLVQLGLCSSKPFNFRSKFRSSFELLQQHFGIKKADSLSRFAMKKLGVKENDSDFQKLVWLGLFDDKPLLWQPESPAHFLQTILEEKWKFLPTDNDRVVMIHELVYESEGKKIRQIATLDRIGNSSHTAMAETVGLPIGIAAELILCGRLQLSGVLRPTMKAIYKPVLAELGKNGIVFEHFTQQLS